MRRIRGIIALLVAIVLGFLAVQLVSHYLNRPKATNVKKVQKKSGPQKKSFTKAISEGMRVITIAVEKLPKIKSGDLVDIFAINPLPGKTEGKVSRIILEKVQVFEAGKGSGEVSGYLKKKGSQLVSLLLKPEEAGILTAATKAADITLVRRSKTDDADNTENNFASFIYSRASGPIISYGRNGDFSRTIPQGLRALTIKIKDTDGLCGVLKPGDRVDIIITCPYSRFASRGLTPGAEGQVTQYRIGARVLAQNLEILANEATLMPGSDPNAPVRNVTLAVTPQQAITLTASTEATKKSAIKLVLRRRDDREKLNLKPVNVADLLTEKRMFRQVEVIKGSQVKLVPFFR